MPSGAATPVLPTSTPSTGRPSAAADGARARAASPARTMRRMHEIRRRDGLRSVYARRMPHGYYVVLRALGGDRWQLVGEARRRPGLPARAARAQAIADATSG